MSEEISNIFFNTKVIERYIVLSNAKFIDRLRFYERRNVLKLRFAQKCIHSFNLYVIKNEVLEQRNLTLKFFIEFRRLLMLNYRLTIRYYRPEIIFHLRSYDTFLNLTFFQTRISIFKTNRMISVRIENISKLNY